jgi:hypothetical protein
MALVKEFAHEILQFLEVGSSPLFVSIELFIGEVGLLTGGLADGATRTRSAMSSKGYRIPQGFVFFLTYFSIISMRRAVIAIS